MKLNEFEIKNIEEMSKEELEEHILNTMQNLEQIVDDAHARMDRENAKNNNNNL